MYATTTHSVEHTHVICIHKSISLLKYMVLAVLTPLGRTRNSSIGEGEVLRAPVQASWSARLRHVAGLSCLCTCTRAGTRLDESRETA